MNLNTRSVAFQFFFEMIRQDNSELELSDLLESTEEHLSEEKQNQITLLVRNAFKQKDELLNLLKSNLREGQTLKSVSDTDQMITMLAYYELQNLGPSQNGAHTLNDYIEIAKKFGTKESYSFVNVMGDKILKKKNLNDNI